MANDFSSCEAIATPHRKHLSQKATVSFSPRHKQAIPNPHPHKRFRIAKFLGNILFSLASFLILIPLLAVLTLLLFVTSWNNPFFLQNRMGKNRNLFRIIKFKTMNEKRDSDGTLLPDEQRLTKMGKFLRKTSLDELPQLLNVLKGDMSLIGPRPWIPEQMAMFSLHEQKCRCRVKPGITGLAQVYGRNGLTFRERLPYDVWYVRYSSLRIDLVILWKTIGKVLKQEGIHQRTDALVNPAKFSR